MRPIKANKIASRTNVEFSFAGKHVREIRRSRVFRRLLTGLFKTSAAATLKFKVQGS